MFTRRSGRTAPVTFGSRSHFPPVAGGVRGDGFRLSGTYLDRSQRNEYPIVTSWND